MSESSRPLPKPRVLIVENSMAFTGAFRSVLAAARQQQENFGFHFVLPTGSKNVSLIREAGFSCDELPFVELGRSVSRLLRYGPMLLLNAWRLARLVRRYSVDVLHGNDLYNLTPIVARWFLWGRRPKLVMHVRMLAGSFSGPFYEFWCWCAATFADRVVCVSEAVRQRAFAHEPKAVVVYDTIERIEHHPPKTNFALSPPLRVVYLGNYIHGKGQETALAAFAQARQHFPALRIDFYGGTMGLAKNQEFRDTLEAQAQQQGLGEAVGFHAFASDVEALMKASDVVLNCSEVESFSMVCFEALYYGVPLIATDCGGPRELFEDERSGYLVPVGDAAAAADRLVRLATDATKRAAFSAAGRAFLEKKFGERDTSAAIWQF